MVSGLPLTVSSRPWESLEETTKDTEKFFALPRPSLTDPQRQASGAQDIIGKEESQTIEQSKRRVRENEHGDLVEDFVKVTTETRTRTWTNNKQVKQEWTEKFNLQGR